MLTFNDIFVELILKISRHLDKVSQRMLAISSKYINRCMDKNLSAAGTMIHISVGAAQLEYFNVLKELYDSSIVYNRIIKYSIQGGNIEILN